jgi:hypothetical protein
MMFGDENDENSETCSKHGEMRNAYKLFVEKSEGKGSLESTRHEFKNNLKLCKYCEVV